MNRKNFILLLLYLTAFHVFAADAEDQADRDGRALATELSAMAPTQNSHMTGTLTIRRDKKRISVPLEINLQKGHESWSSSYQTKATNGNPAINLTVIQSLGKSSQYEIKTEGVVQTLTNNLASIPFAESDFWLTDLGLEFFHWPKQRLIKRELRRGQSCYVLESRNPDPEAAVYSKVISWIDRDTLGIVFAEAYDQKGKILKTFAPKSFRKVNGHYQVKDVEIRNEQTGSRTRLEFDAETE